MASLRGLSIDLSREEWILTHIDDPFGVCPSLQRRSGAMKKIAPWMIVALVSCIVSGCFGIGHPKRRPTTYDMRRSDLDQVEHQLTEYRAPERQ
jgi:hypothetical protein